MRQFTDDEKTILQEKICKLLKKSFKMKTISEESDNALFFEVTGTVRRYHQNVNVQVTVKKENNEPTYWSIADDSITLYTKHIGDISFDKEVVVSDPCYDRDVWCMTILKNVRPGNWKVFAAIDAIDSWGKRVYVLELQHKDIPNQNLDWVEYTTLGVDSGTMSVIADNFYHRKNGSVEEFEADQQEQEAFMDKCFNLTNKHIGLFQVNNINVGVVCSSGIGDGSYPLYTVEQNGEVVAMKINFM